MVNRGERTELLCQPVRFDRNVILAILGKRRDDKVFVVRAFFLGKQTDECGIQSGAAGLREQFRRRTRVENLSLVHRDEPVETLSFIHVGGCDNDAHVRLFRADVRYQFPELAARQRIDAGRRLVEDKQVGIMNQRAAKTELLLHSARKISGAAVQKRIKPGALRQTVDTASAFRRVVSEQTRKELKVLFNGKSKVKVFAEPLRHVGDAGTDRFAVRLVAHVSAQNVHGTGLHGVRPRNKGEQTGFAHAVGADQTDQTAGENIHGNVVERERFAVSQTDIPDTDNRFRHIHFASFLI